MRLSAGFPEAPAGTGEEGRRKGPAACMGDAVLAAPRPPTMTPRARSNSWAVSPDPPQNSKSKKKEKKKGVHFKYRAIDFISRLVRVPRT